MGGNGVGVEAWLWIREMGGTCIGGRRAEKPRGGRRRRRVCFLGEAWRAGSREKMAVGRREELSLGWKLSEASAALLHTQTSCSGHGATMAFG